MNWSFNHFFSSPYYFGRANLSIEACLKSLMPSPQDRVGATGIPLSSGTLSSLTHPSRLLGHFPDDSSLESDDGGCNNTVTKHPDQSNLNRSETPFLSTLTTQSTPEKLSPNNKVDGRSHRFWFKWCFLLPIVYQNSGTTSFYLSLNYLEDCKY